MANELWCTSTLGTSGKWARKEGDFHHLWYRSEFLAVHWKTLTLVEKVKTFSHLFLSCYWFSLWQVPFSQEFLSWWARWSQELLDHAPLFSGGWESGPDPNASPGLWNSVILEQPWPLSLPTEVGLRVLIRATEAILAFPGTGSIGLN